MRLYTKYSEMKVLNRILMRSFTLLKSKLRREREKSLFRGCYQQLTILFISLHKILLFAKQHSQSGSVQSKRLRTLCPMDTKIETKQARVIEHIYYLCLVLG